MRVLVQFIDPGTKIIIATADGAYVRVQNRCRIFRRH
jgi:hypothetical protein